MTGIWNMAFLTILLLTPVAGYADELRTVTSVADSGDGSLRSAVKALTDHTRVIFKIKGNDKVIKLAQPVVISQTTWRLTIDATAPPECNDKTRVILAAANPEEPLPSLLAIGATPGSHPDCDKAGKIEIRGLEFRNASEAILCAKVCGVLIEECQFGDPESYICNGIHLEGCKHFRIYRNRILATFQSGRMPTGNGVLIKQSAYVIVERNTIQQTNPSQELQSGINLTDSYGCVARWNEISAADSGGGAIGIKLLGEGPNGCHEHLIERNVIRASVGLTLEAAKTNAWVSDNRVVGNYFIALEQKGISVTSADGGMAQRNVIKGNFIQCPPASTGVDLEAGASANRVVGNIIRCRGISADGLPAVGILLASGTSNNIVGQMTHSNSLDLLTDGDDPAERNEISTDEGAVAIRDESTSNPPVANTVMAGYSFP